MANLIKDINLYVQEAQQTPRRINSKRFTVRYIVIKLLKAKNIERILTAAREN